MPTKRSVRRVLGPGLLALAGALVSHPATVQAAGGAMTPAMTEVDNALARKEYSAALRAANEVYRAATGTQRWDTLICAGELYRRIGQATGLRVSFETKAREAYQKALFRARQQASLEGVLRATEGYAMLGAEKMVTLGLRVAERLASGDREAQADVRSFRARIESRLTAGDTQR